MTSPNLDPTRPSWVILGVDAGDQVAIYASRELDDKVVDWQVDYVDIRALCGGLVRSPITHIELTVGMRSIVVAVGDTYGEAFARLFDFWKPDQPTDVPAIGSRPAIGPARPQGA